MQAYPSYSEIQRQNELRKIAEAQNRLAYLEQQQQMQNGNMQASWQGSGQMQNQNIQSNMIIGKIVNDFSELTANDVPMNGSAAFFPKADGSELQVRNWTPNGTIQTIVYRPVQPENQSEGANIPQVDFNALNDDVRALRKDILARLDAIEKSVSKPSARGKKAEVIADE